LYPVFDDIPLVNQQQQLLEDQNIQVYKNNPEFDQQK